MCMGQWRCPTIRLNCITAWGTQGGVIDYRIQYALMNAVIRRSKFPPEFGAKMHGQFQSFSELQKMVEEAEKNIPGKHWIHLDKAARNEYDQLMHDIRVSWVRKDFMITGR